MFAVDDDCSMGILSSSVHRAWATGESSTLRVDLRYTPTTAFATFPWPDPDEATRARIGELSASIIQRRLTICAEREIGLTELYNMVDDGAWQDLAETHAKLDAAVAEAYGWPKAWPGSRCRSSSVWPSATPISSRAASSIGRSNRGHDPGGHGPHKDDRGAPGPPLPSRRFA